MVVRATQFFEFLGGIAQANTKDQVARLPSALMHPISADGERSLMLDNDERLVPTHLDTWLGQLANAGPVTA